MSLRTEMIFKSFLSLILLMLCCLQVVAQKASIQLGPDKVAQNQYFQVSLNITDMNVSDYSGFPDIPGFRKGGVSNSSGISIVNGRRSTNISITMNYIPTQQGTFAIKPFSMKVNGTTTVSSPGKKVTVGPPAQRQRPKRRRLDPFGGLMDDFFNDSREEVEFVDIDDDAFLAMTTNKDEVYVGEGLTVTVSLYIAETNRAPLNFQNDAKLSEEIFEMKKKLEVPNAWHENFGIKSIHREPVSIKGKRYNQFKLYQSSLYPLNDEDFELPSVTLEMIKHKISKRRTIFGYQSKEGFKTFRSKAKKIKVKPLPPHPLKETVAVGDFQLDERISATQLTTGESFSYGFNIYGEGNISTLQKPEIPKDDIFEFYTPNITEKINRRRNRVTGSKSFSYYAIPNEPGEYALKDYFKWVFFNPKTEKYDTLIASENVIVSGESKKNESIQDNDLGGFYDNIDLQANTLSSTRPAMDLKLWANLLILVMLVLSAIFVFKK